MNLLRARYAASVAAEGMTLGWFKKRRRAKILAAPTPLAWLEIVGRRVAYFQLLPPEDRSELFDYIKIFISEKHFEGCGGLVVTEEMKVVIAAQACILLLHHFQDCYAGLESILIYPHPYLVQTQTILSGGVVVDGQQARLGESWGYGTVVLAWDDVLQGARDAHAGHNVVMHEFAHQLDNESGPADGVPPLELRSQYTAWARVLSEEFHQLHVDAEHHRKTVMDRYGATNAAEFFAVATETFFEKPVQLQRKHPQLYDELRLYYKQDPARFHGM